MLTSLLGVLTLAVPGAADPASTRAQIESVLAEMSSAALAADQPAFLSSIALDDRFLATEWKHWAAALADNKPQEFSLSIGDGPATFDDSRAQFPLVMSWLIT